LCTSKELMRNEEMQLNCFLTKSPVLQILDDLKMIGPWTTVALVRQLAAVHEDLALK
jgi:hypothetical protein